MAQIYPHLHAVILAEDYGERLWPITREQAPACFAPVEPGSEESLLAASAKRLHPYTEYPLHVVTTEPLRDLAFGELVAQTGIDPSDIDIMSLPAQRGSAFAVALACARIRRSDPAAIVVVMPADLRIEDDDRWGHVLYRAYQVALRDRVVLLGSQQERRRGLVSYIRHGRQFQNIDGAYEVRLFSVEGKLAAAQRAIAEGGYRYTGIFVARAVSVLGALTHAGDVGETPETAGSGRIAETAGFFSMLDEESWHRKEAREVIDVLPDVSIEKAAFENSHRLVVLPVTIGITQVVSLEDFDTAGKVDAGGNRVIGSALNVDSRHTTVIAARPARLVTTYGLEDVLVVDTPDALLVASKSRLRDMETLHEALSERDASQLVSSVRRPFPWGIADQLASPGDAAVWQLRMRPGATLDALSVPFAYDAFETADPDARREIREQYAVASGSVFIKSRGADAEPVAMSAGDAFEVDPDDPLEIRCAEEEPAMLVLTAVSPRM